MVNMSSSGVLVTYPHEISVGTRMELNIEWPSRLDGRIPLQLIAVGSVVRCETVSFAVGLERHYFRTTAGTHLASDGWFGEARRQTVRKASA